MRDQCLSVLEICRGFVTSWSDRFLVIAGSSALARHHLSDLVIPNRGFGCCGLPGAPPLTELRRIS